MWEKIKKILHYLVFPVLFITGLIFGRSLRHDNSGSSDEIDGDISRAEELAERASDQLREFEKSVECLGNELNGTRSKLEQARDSYRRSSDTLDRLRIAVNGIEGTSRRAEEIARRYDELDSETERILQELLRRAGTKAVFAEDAEHNTDSIHSDSLRHSGDSSHPKLKEE